MPDEVVYPLKKFNNHFISHKGYVFYIARSREINCPRFKDKFGRVQVKIEGKDYDLLYLMLEYFYPRHNPEHTAYGSYDKTLRIPSRSIRFKKTKSDKITDEDESHISLWKCAIKAGGANARSNKRITKYEIYRILKLMEFHCIYCGDELRANTWHLDHFHPLSLGGRNVYKNLAPSCARCNIMKGSLDGFAFLRQCKKILTNTLIAKDEIKESEQDGFKLEQLMSPEVFGDSVEDSTLNDN